MAREHAIQCGITRVPRVYVKRGPATYRPNGQVYVGGIQIGEVFEARGKWIAVNSVNTRVKSSEHKSATTAVKALVCGQVKSERTSRGQLYGRRRR